MSWDEYDYDLPKELIAQEPLVEREQSRLMVIDRAGQTITHERFFELGKYVNKGDLLVFNNTRVRPARLMGQKPTGGRVEILLLKETEGGWEFWGRNLHGAKQVTFPEGLVGQIEGEKIKFNMTGPKFWETMEKIGQTPVPPYIHSQLAEAQLRARYQTVYAKKAGSSAAPTAGLHFSQKLLDELKDAGVKQAEVTLHVGLGTFAPLTAENLASGKLHEESYEIPPDTIKQINHAKQASQKVIAVGTTTVRTLESWMKNGRSEGETDLFIRPGFEFKCVDGLITNFHLPKSSLLMLVAAFGGIELIQQAYQEAVREKYRFFSFGDAMLIR